MPTLSQAVETFLAVERSKQTGKQYRIVLNAFISWAGGDRDLQSLNFEALLAYLGHLRSRRTGRSQTPLKDSTIANHIQTLKSLMNFCVSSGYIAESPAKRLTVRRRAEDPNQQKAIPPEELAKIIDAAKYHPRNYALILFLADTGCRVGGLCSLTLDRLFLSQRTATLREKGDQWVEVYFGKRTADALAAWLALRPETAHNHVWTAAPPKFEPLKRGAVEYILRELSRKTGASRLWNPHAIRHGVGHALAKQGVPVSIVQRKLGHSDPTTTMRTYYPHDRAYLRQVSEQFSLIALGQPGAPSGETLPTVQPEMFIPLPFDPVEAPSSPAAMPAVASFTPGDPLPFDVIEPKAT